MIPVNEGERYRSRITGNVYDLKKVVNERVVLETPNGVSEVLTELRMLKLFYERESKKDEDQR
jgi:hypothetical protein